MIGRLRRREPPGKQFWPSCSRGEHQSQHLAIDDLTLLGLAGQLLKGPLNDSNALVLAGDTIALVDPIPST